MPARSTPRSSAPRSPSRTSSAPRAAPEVMRAYREALPPSPTLVPRPAPTSPSSPSAPTRRPRPGGGAGAAICSCCGSTRVASGPTPPSRRPRPSVHDRDLAIIQHTRQRTIAGAPEQVRDRLLALGRRVRRRGVRRRDAWPTTSKCASVPTSFSPTSSSSRRGEAKPRGQPLTGSRCLSWLRPLPRQILAHRRQVGMDLEGAAEHRGGLARLAEGE